MLIDIIDLIGALCYIAVFIHVFKYWINNRDKPITYIDRNYDGCDITYHITQKKKRAKMKSTIPMRKRV